VLGCLGDGGAVLTNDEEIYRKILLLRDHGRDESGEIVIWGFNSRLDNIQAALFDYQLEYYPKVVERRRAIGRLYKTCLKDLEQLVLPPGPDNDPDHFDVYQNYEIEKACLKHTVRNIGNNVFYLVCFLTGEERSEGRVSAESGGK